MRLTDNFFDDIFSVIEISLLFSFVAVLALTLIWATDSIGKRNKQPFGLWTTYLFGVVAISTIGAIAGYTGGLSRVGAVGDIVPAALGLLGGVSLYLFGAKENPSAWVPISAAAFSLALVGGFSIGSENRIPAERKEFWRDACVSLFMSSDTMSKDAFQIASNAFGERCFPLIQNDFEKVFTIVPLTIDAGTVSQ